MSSHFNTAWEIISDRHGWSCYDSPSEHDNELSKAEMDYLEEAYRSDYYRYIERELASEHADLMY